MHEFADRPKAVVLITGISAAGKSTVAQALAERLRRSVHVRGDLFRRMIVNGGVGMTPELEDEALRQLRLRYKLAASTADAYFEAGFTAVVQDVVIGPELKTFVSFVRSRPLIVVVLAPDAATVAGRDLGRSKTGYRDWTVEQLDQGMREGTPRIGLWLDTSGQTPAETVQEILARAWDEGVVD
ncbi:AAA family ATPase [Sphaerisporangium fuscum]|uniref:AAA family ATPase n=1 Tax=Sphaerisporangium fuscum TaxID=2835868 RepID=UPI001BDBD3E2|nr:AAA family ATPase [Sphaerisporangium fuscum]